VTAPTGVSGGAIAWTADQLARIGDAEELRLAPRSDDGTLYSFTTMWVVRAGDELYVRSAGGPRRPWYRYALASHEGRIQAGGVEAEVSASPRPTPAPRRPSTPPTTPSTTATGRPSSAT